MKVSRRLRILCCILFCMFTILMQLNIKSAQAQPTNTPGELPGWPVDLNGAWRFTSDIIVTDIDEDNDDEVIMGIDNMVHIIDKTGENLPGWPQKISDSITSQVTAIAVGDIDADGNIEIVCTGGARAYAWHAETGTLVDGWPLVIGGEMALGNFDDNPLDLEMAIAVVHEYYSPELQIYILNSDGTNVDGWPQDLDINRLSQVYLSTGNIDNTGSDEIVVACHKRGYSPSSIYVFHGDGQLVSGWPIQGNGPFVLPAVLCNLDDNDDYEVVAATVNESHTGRIYAWKPNGVSVSGWPRAYNAFDLAVGDLDSDDWPEIVACYSNSDYWGDHLAVLDHLGTRLLSKTLELRTAASLANADYDTDSEIIIPTWNGELQVMDIYGQNLPGFPIYITNGIQSCQSAIGDLDGDGDIEIVQLDREERKLHAFDLKAPKSDHPDWPMARHDERRSSLWTPPRTPGSDVLEISGPLLVMENSSTQYTAWAYFEDGSNKDVTLEATWWVDPCYADYAHFETGGVLIAHQVSTFKDIIIYAEYVEGDYVQSASYEVHIRPTVQILYVDDDAANDPGPNDPAISDPDEHGTEQHPFDSIQEAMDVAGDGDKVIVLPGEYYENIDFKGKNFTLTSTNPEDPTGVNATKIYSESGYAITASDGDILGLSILGNGGIRCGENVYYTCYSPTIRNCHINVSGCGVNIFVPYMHEVVYPVIENNIIEGGMGIYIFVQAFGDGFEATIRNNTIIGKGFSSFGCGIQYRTHKEVPFVSNNIISNFKYGICLTYASKLEERKARICYNNLYDNQENYHIDSPPTPLDLTGVNGNISEEPLFIDFANGDYHLRPNSPCINAGDPNYIAGLDEVDIDGQPRVWDGRVDMGADEFVPMIEAAMKFTPQALNPGSKGRWVKAHFVLPEGFAVEDVDVNTPIVIEPLGIESEYMNVFFNEDGLVEIEAVFSRAAFCGAATDCGPIEVTVVGRFVSGQNFYGTDTIRIINDSFRYLTVLTSHWLEDGCGRPDWCDGIDFNKDCKVDFIDFAILADNCLVGTE